MPELPEVETIRRNLLHGTSVAPSVLGCSILRAQVEWPRSIAIPGTEEFLKIVRHQQIQDIIRRGKYLIFQLTHGDLLIHLRMSGDLQVVLQATPPAHHRRVGFTLDNQYRIDFIDPRKFGRLWLVDKHDEITGKLGPEPLDETLTPTRFYQMLREHRGQIKPLLLNQHFLAGLGNIYTDEALFRAGIHPKHLSMTLTENDAACLLESIRFVLTKGIETNGASIDWVYRGGGFQNHFQVYQRAGEPCPHCGTPIQRIVVQQRGTHFCPECQPISGRN